MMVKGTYMGMDVLGYFIETPNKTLSLNNNDEYEATKRELLCVALCFWGGVIRPFLFYYHFSNELKLH